MSQPVVNELRQVYDLWQNGLTARSVYEAAAKDLLGKLLSDESVSLSDKHQGLKAAKQYVTNHSLLLEAGNKLVQMHLEHFSTGGTAGPSSPQGPQVSGSTSVSDFRKYGYEGSQDGTSMDESEAEAVSGDEQAESDTKDAWEKYDQLCAEEEEYDREAAPILAEIAAAAAKAAAAGQEQPGCDTQHASDQARGGQGQPGTSLGAAASGAGAEGGKPPAAAAAAAAAGGDAAGDDDVDMVDSELLSDLDTEDGTAEEVEAADEAALKEIRHFQREDHMLVSRAAFTCVAEEVLQQQGGAEYSFDSGAVDALQRACESYLVEAFETANTCTVHAERQKVQVKDMQLAAYLTDNWRARSGQASQARQALREAEPWFSCTLAAGR